MTLNGRNALLQKKKRFTERARQKNLNEDRIVLSADKFRRMILVSIEL